MSDPVRPRRRQPTRLPRPWDSPGKNTGVGFHFLLQCMKVKSESEVAQSCPTLSNPMDCSLPGSSVHGIFQARVLEWGAVAFSMLAGSLQIQSKLLNWALRAFHTLSPFSNSLFLCYSRCCSRASSDSTAYELKCKIEGSSGTIVSECAVLTISVRES